MSTVWTRTSLDDGDILDLFKTLPDLPDPKEDDFSFLARLVRAKIAYNAPQSDDVAKAIKDHEASLEAAKAKVNATAGSLAFADVVKAVESKGLDTAPMYAAYKMDAKTVRGACDTHALALEEIATHTAKLAELRESNMISAREIIRVRKVAKTGTSSPRGEYGPGRYTRTVGDKTILVDVKESDGKRVAYIVGENLSFPIASRQGLNVGMMLYGTDKDLWKAWVLAGCSSKWDTWSDKTGVINAGSSNTRVVGPITEEVKTEK